MQITNEQNNGIYLLSGKTLKFYSLENLNCETVYTFDGCTGAYAADDLLYVLYSRTCYVYDLNEKALSQTISFESLYAEDTVSSLNAIGADASGRIYIATTGSADSESVYQIWLYTSNGTLLSSAATDARIYNFSGFDDDGNFFMESYYDWVYWGYSHPGRAVTMGTVTDGVISFTQTSGSLSLDYGGISMVYSLSCLEYLCQSYYYLHQRGADVIGGMYLVTASTTYGRVMVMDADSLESVLYLSRSAIEEEQDDDYYDTNSIGVRTVYNEANESIVIYENEKTLNEYDIESGEIIGTYATAHYVFNLLTLGDDVIAIEKEDDEWYIEIIAWAAPTSFSIEGDSTMQVGESQELTITSAAGYETGYEWSSSDSGIVSVTSDGKATAWAEGSAVITYASPDGSYSASFTITVSGSAISSPSETSEDLNGLVSNNISDNNYTTYYANVVNSYIVENDDGTLTRVEYTGSSVLVEIYSADHELLSSQTVSMELNIFGGFYAGEDFYYLVFGQSNTSEDDALEVIRVVKYTKSWSRVSACAISAVNTYVPFDAGSLRMTELDGLLYIYTCHTMYDEGDGYHHQANMTFVIDETSMTVSDSYYDVLNIAQAGYVSHSFNQYIATDGEYIYRVDQGDYAPRAVSITKCKVGDSITSVSYTYALAIGGTSGANATGVSVGGLALSDENILIAGNTVDQDADSYSAYGQRNIFLTVTDKTYLDTTQIYLTDYDSDDGITPRTPQLVKLSEDAFLIMWEEYDSSTGVTVTRAVTVNGDGTQTSDIVSLCVRLSDCQPIVTSEGLVTWYVTDGSSMTLYQMNPFALDEMVSLSHSYEAVTTDPTCTQDGSTTYTCSVCGDSYSVTLPATGHDYQAVVTAPTCTLDGYTTYTCSKCGDVYTDDITQAPGHSYDENDICTVCGAEKPSVASADITMASSFGYTGSAVTPDVTVTIDGVVLEEGTDYTVSYSDNVEIGTASVTITGQGDYKGTITKTFKITVNIIELYGDTRYGTMTAIAEETFESASYAVVATGTNFADALAAASLAGVLDAPVILVNEKQTNIDTALNELTQLGVTNVYITGGTAAVSESIADQIRALGIGVERLSGENRRDTALAIAQKVQELSGDEMSKVCLVATGGNFADALSGSPYAYYTGSPIYLTKNDGEITEDVLSAIEEGGYETVIILGGTSAVSEDSYEALCGIDGVSVERIAGDNRYQTSYAFAEWAVAQGMTYDGMAVATGLEFADALSGAALCGQNGSVLLLAHATAEKSTVLESALKENVDDITKLYILGGTAAVSEDVRELIRTALE